MKNILSFRSVAEAERHLGGPMVPGEDVMKILNVSRRSLSALIESEVINPVRVGNKNYFPVSCLKTMKRFAGGEEPYKD